MSDWEDVFSEGFSRLDLSEEDYVKAVLHERIPASRHSRKRSREEDPGSKGQNSSKRSSNSGSRSSKQRKRGSTRSEPESYQPTRIPIPDPAHMSGALATWDDVGIDQTKRGDLVRDSSSPKAWKLHPEYEDNTLSKVNIKRVGGKDEQDDTIAGSGSGSAVWSERSKALSDKKMDALHKKFQREKKKFIKAYINSEEFKYSATENNSAKGKGKKKESQSG